MEMVRQKLYDGPVINQKELRRPFWNKEKTLPLGGCMKVTFDHGIDGDTASFHIDKEARTVRFFVIDTPELNPEPKPYAIEAKNYTTKMLEEAKEIILQSDEFDDLVDSTVRKRLLAWVWVDGELLNYELARLGFATVRYISSPKMKYLPALKVASLLAEQEKLGIFSTDSTV